jgi:predicted nucleotidyltransferase component of viral defense system
MATLIQTLQNVLAGKDPLLSVETKRIVLKDCLQAFALDYIYNHPRYRRLNFYGGTCLHVIYGLNRLSEDLDFDNSVDIELEKLGIDLLKHFQIFFGYQNITTKIQEGIGGILRITLRYPILYELGLSQQTTEAIHLKLEFSHHKQTAVIQHTPVLTYGRSLVAAHFSLETMMAGKMLACLERSFMRGQAGIEVKGRDYYDLLWFMQQQVWPLEEKLVTDGRQQYSISSAMLALQENVASMKSRDLSLDLLPLFESRVYIESWLESFRENFDRLVKNYIEGKS